MSALLLAPEWARVGCQSSVANAQLTLQAATNSKPELQTGNSTPPTAALSRNGPEIMLANDAQMAGAMLLAQNGPTQNGTGANRVNKLLDLAHLAAGPRHAPTNHAHSTTKPTNPPAGPEPGDPHEFYEFAATNETNADAETETDTETDPFETGDAAPHAADHELQNPTRAEPGTEFEFDDNSPSRDILTQYLFILFRHRNMFIADQSNEQSAGNGSALAGDLSTADRDLLGLSGETPQLMGEQASVGAGRASASGLPGGSAGTLSHSSHPGAVGDELNPNALWVSTTNRPYLGEFFSALNSAYLPYHSVICLVICVIGIFSNVTNIIVLTRPNMITAVNTILCAIACSDLIVNLSNIPYLSHLLSDTSDPTNFFTYGWALYTLMHAHVSVTAHTISIWLTCVLATWRYFVIRSQSISQRNWSVQLVLRVILAVIICVPILCTPSYLSFAILVDPPNMGIGTTYRVGFSRLAEQSQVIRTFHFWMFSALTKLLPCVMLAFFTIVLVKKLLQARDRRLRLAQGNGCATNNNLGGQLTSNSQAGTNLTSFDSQHGRLSIPNGRPPNSPALERQHSVKDTRSHVHVIDQLTGSNEPILAHEIANGGADEPSEDKAPPRRRPKMSQASENLQQLARRESLRNVLVGNRRQGSHDSGGPAANESLELEQRLQRGAFPVAPLSGSSCNTDAECLQASSRNGSSNGSINISLEPFHLDFIQAPDARTTQVFGHLLVESALSPASHASSATAQHRTTLISPLSPSSGASSPRGELELGLEQAGNEGARYPANSLAVDEAPRSASTCGALELYAQLDAHDGNETSLRLGALTPAPPAARSTRHLPQQSTRPSLAVSAQDFKAHENETNLLARGSLSHSNLKPAAEQRLAGAADGRGRSMGSATFTPFQIVKLQATQRQLSQNETTTRLLIGVMIIFLICEFPAGILSALCAIFGQGFFDNVYQPMGPFTDLFALINSSVNFILYCFMSTQFRVTFYRVVLRCPAPSAPKSNNK